jgi:Cu/Zn superoxide dismutase
LNDFLLIAITRSDSSGSVTIDLEDSIIQLHNLSRSSILNKSIVVHKDEDDLGHGAHSDSHTTG